VTRDAIKSILDVNNEALSEKYLGMPSDVRVRRIVPSSTSKIVCGSEYRVGWSSVSRQEGRRC
jgi:hypothetical protein